MFWIPAAYGLGFGTNQTLLFDDEIVAMAGKDVDGDGVVERVTAHPTEVKWFGSSTGTLAFKAHGIAPWEQGFVLCSDAGLFTWTERQLTDVPCTQVTAVDLDDDGDEDLATVGERFVLWENINGSLVIRSEPLSEVLPRPILDAHEGNVLLGFLGSPDWARMTADTVVEGQAVGPMGGFAAPGPSYSLPDNHGVVLEEVFLPTDASPGLLFGGDATGDTLTEWLVLHEALATLVVDGTPTVWSIPRSTQAPPLALWQDANGDGCADLWVAEGNQLTLLYGNDCLSTIDVDEDGFTAATGDCDESDPNRNPEAIETCDGQDTNCNGEIDEVLPELTGLSMQAIEGQRFTISPDIAGCWDHLAWDPVDLPWLGCDWETSLDLSCDALDQGEASLLVMALAADRNILGEGLVDLNVINEPPSTSEIDGVTLRIGESWSQPFAVYEPGAFDDVHLSVEGPEGMEVQDQTLWFTASKDQVGTHDVALTISDNDGGTTTQQTTVTVVGRSGCAVVTGPKGWAWVLLFLFARQRKYHA